MKKFGGGLVWFRRDLRWQDHAALYHALTQCGRVYCVFVFDRDILDSLKQQGITADRRVEFILNSLAELNAALYARGGRLWVQYGLPTEEIPKLVQQLKVEAVFANEDYEPSAKQRDLAVEKILIQQNCAFFRFRDQVIFAKDELLTAQGQPFSVFTPYKNAWLKRLTSADLASYPVEKYLSALAPINTLQELPSLEALGFQPSNLVTLPLPCGMSGAQQLFGEFQARVGAYRTQRDFPSVKGPSYLSVHLRFGTISIRVLARFAYETAFSQPSVADGANTWLSELIWRDFYFMILHHYPYVVESAFKPSYDAIKWDNNPEQFSAWCSGNTGYPLVDAAMQQLNQTGYMHNRLRMVSASFLIKDLGIDWRWGERYFARHLNDFDLSANNGGWQWAASSGCDAQPYFRIFNPVTQSQKFDVHGKFIKRYLPQLSKVPEHYIHAPWEMPLAEQQACETIIGKDYPAPIVEHAIARQRTLARYAIVKSPAIRAG
jgi:deoxyribodipyrimidine photo-lyase